MTTCRVCTELGGPRETPVTSAAGHEESPSEGAALLLRVWRDGDLRARLLGVDPPYRTVATAQGIDGICDAVRAWLSRL
jgi:hypothetical protein